MSMTALKEIRGKIDERRAKLHEVFEQAGPDMDMSKVTVLEGDSTAKVEAINKMNDEITSLAKEAEPLEREFSALEAAKRQADQMGELRDLPLPGGKATTDRRRATESRSLGDLFVASEAYTKHQRGSVGAGPMAELDLDASEIQATVFKTSAGWAPESLRTGVVVPYATRPIQIIDLIPTAETSSAAVVYMEETTFTNNAAERNEGAAYVESALALTQRSVTVRSIGTSLPITDEQLDDVDQARTYVDGRMGFFVRQRLDSQLLNGDGNAPNITGFLNASNLQTQAKGADPVPDAVYKALVKVRVTGRAFPSAAIFHPNDWQDIRLLRTADGVYIWGNPSDAGPERIWGLQVVQSDAITQNTGLVGDFSAAMCQLYIRKGLEVQIGYVNDDFKLGQQTVRAGVRCALVVYRGAAYSTVTGI